jgi:N6-adenosine-specific RNA methylase IME4
VIEAAVLSLPDADAALLAEIDENLIRGELTDAERARHRAERKRLYEVLYPQTKHGGAPGKAGGGKEAKVVNVGEPRFTAVAALQTNESERTVQRDITRAKRIPQLADLVGTSLDDGVELDALAKLPAEKQSELIARAKAGDKVTAKHAVKAIRRTQRAAELADATKRAATELGTKLYGVIYADPPWHFEPYSRETGMDRAADNHYPTMALAELKATQPPAAANCVLFLWATAPMLQEALELMRAWGFAYRTHCVWVKDRIGTGYWFRNRHELLLVGVRGKIPPVPGEQFVSVIEAAVGQHSAKPNHFAEMIEEMLPNVPAVEMFARGARLGWDSWGNEAAPAPYC